MAQKQNRRFAVVNKRGVVITVPCQVGDDMIYVEAIFSKKAHAKVWATSDLKIEAVFVVQP